MNGLRRAEIEVDRHTVGVAEIEVGAPSALVELIRGLSGKRARVVVVAFDSPYLLMQIPNVPAYMIAWGGFAASQRAAARALVGAAPITGQLPITIPGNAAYGAGLQRGGR